MKAFIDLDDLWHPDQIEKHLVPIKAEVPDFKVCCYAIPNKLGPVHDLSAKYPWVTFAMHGFEHTPFECRAWTQEDAERYIDKALGMGYAAVFKPPNWIFDEELVRACEVKKIVLHHHESEDLKRFKGPLPRLYPGPKEWRINDHVNFHSHITRNPVTDSVEDHPAFRVERLKTVEKFLTVEDVAI